MTTERLKLNSIRLYRFQSYLDTKIDFTKDTTAILGDTDAGKSALTRAIKFVLYGKASFVAGAAMDDLITWGADSMFVTLEFSNGYSITRGRQKDTNYYIIKDPKGNEEKLTGFGVGVPPEVTALHRMFTFEVGNDFVTSLNISEQMEPSFMMTMSAPQKAKVLGKISGADRTDSALGVINSWGRAKTKDIKTTQTKLTSLKKEVEKYSFVEALKQNIEEFSATIDKDIIPTKEKVEALQDVCEEFKTLNELLSQAEIIAACDEQLLSLEEIIQYINSQNTMITNLNTLVMAMNELNAANEVCGKVLSAEPMLDTLQTMTDTMIEVVKYADILIRHSDLYSSLVYELARLETLTELSDEVEKLDVLCGEMHSVFTRLSTLISIKEEHETLITRALKGSTLIEALESDYAKVCEEYESLLKTAGHCPVCNSKID